MSFARSQEERGTHRGTQQRCLRLSCNDLGCRPCSCKSLQVLMNRSLSLKRPRFEISQNRTSGPLCTNRTPFFRVYDRLQDRSTDEFRCLEVSKHKTERIVDRIALQQGAR